MAAHATSLEPKMEFSGEKIEVAYNLCYGGFSISEKARKEYERRYGYLPDARPEGKDRADPKLISVIKDLGRYANGSAANIYIDEFPKECDDFNAWEITEHDGLESVSLDEYKLMYYQLLKKYNEMSCNA